ncbi:MAG TPA: MarR family transcriptional regulator [Deltaproteobacteria bacterium]|nr:MarR family transcriptional regulator [Deltaproteobacteria bacterium]
MKPLHPEKNASPSHKESGDEESVDFQRPATDEEISQILLAQQLGVPSIDPLGKTDEGISYEVYSLRILMALRRIMHFMDSYSRQLAQEFQITGPQLICLYAIVKTSPITLSELGKRVSLTPSTANGIVDRLEQKGLIQRERTHSDRRKVLITATEKGKTISEKAPLPLQGRLMQAISELPELEQVSIALSLERILEMMEETTERDEP